MELRKFLTGGCKISYHTDIIRIPDHIALDQFKNSE